MASLVGDFGVKLSRAMGYCGDTMRDVVEWLGVGGGGDAASTSARSRPSTWGRHNWGMRLNPVLILAGLAVSAQATDQEKIVVFARHDFQNVERRIAPANGAERQAFLETAAHDLRLSNPLDRTLPLVNPPAWGRTVRPDSRGLLEIAQTYPHGFRFNLTLQHLLPNHDYVLCINGRPHHPGNALLPTPVPGNPAEKYEDFHTVTTDATGSYDGRLALFLSRGPYNVHFYVKDVSDHKIVLYGVEYFDFTAD
jgi:hypothetical protein